MTVVCGNGAENLGRTDVRDEGGRVRHSTVTDELIQKVDQCVCGNRCFMKAELSSEFPQISRTTLYRTVTDRLGYHKFCARWVPKQLTDLRKTQRMGSALMFLQCSWEEGDEFVDRIVNGDETWVQFLNAGDQRAVSTVDAHTFSQQAQEI